MTRSSRPAASTASKWSSPASGFSTTEDLREPTCLCPFGDVDRSPSLRGLGPVSFPSGTWTGLLPFGDVDRSPSLRGRGPVSFPSGTWTGLLPFGDVDRSPSLRG